MMSEIDLIRLEESFFEMIKRLDDITEALEENTKVNEKILKELKEISRKI